MAQSVLISAWRAELHPDNIEYILADQEDCFATLARIDDRGAATLAAALADACGMPRRAHGLARRRASRSGARGSALRSRLSYDDPVRLESGDGVWLTDVDGNRLLDAYNNVPQVGHAHPRVTAALASQARRLTTNTRYLVDEVATYADRLTALLPDELSVVMFVNSGSEANDVAIQIARAVTGNRGVVITEHAYHGTTAATAALSPEELGPAALEPWVARIGGAATLGARTPPSAWRRGRRRVRAASGRGHGPALLDLRRRVRERRHLRRPARLPPRRLRSALVPPARSASPTRCRPASVGSARRSGASHRTASVPDIVTLGKPMGNGHPMGAVVTTAGIAEQFAARWHFFSTFAGSPVAAAVGSAVLDVIERERLAEQAERVGDVPASAPLARWRRRTRRSRRSAGPGSSSESSSTAIDGRPDIGRAVANGLRRRGVLVGATGPRVNVIKIRPPLVFSERHADRVAAALDATLAAEMR